MDNQQKLGVTIIVKRGDKILLGKRKNNYKAGYYGCPGGRLESDETILECAKRELMEETDLGDGQIRYIGFVREVQDDELSFIHFTFIYEIGSHEDPSVVEPDKCEEWEWHSLDELPGRILPGHMLGIQLLKEPSRPYLDLI